MRLESRISQLRQHFGGFNPGADVRALKHLQSAFGKLPAEVLNLYRNHDGQDQRPLQGDVWLGSRLMSIEEVIATNEQCSWFVEGTPRLGDLALLWTDDSSNYLGVYTTGHLAGWLTMLDHEEPILVPAYRSVSGFYDCLLRSLPGVAGEEEQAVDLPTVPREIPQISNDPRHLASDRQLVAAFRELHRYELDADLRRLYAMCAIGLTPIEDTNSVVAFFADQDMWICESAVTLLEVRRFHSAIDELERLAQEGTMNAASAAMRLLVRMRTNPSRQALARLNGSLTGQKLATLCQWLELGSRLQPPRWP